VGLTAQEEHPLLEATHPQLEARPEVTQQQVLVAPLVTMAGLVEQGHQVM
jgi:hypothetical protein